jgi:hypothetical protein
VIRPTSIRSMQTFAQARQVRWYRDPRPWAGRRYPHLARFPAPIPVAPANERCLKSAGAR